MTLPTLTERLDREAPWFGDLPKAAARIRELEAALKPFAKAAEMVSQIGLAHACAAYIKAADLNTAKTLTETTLNSQH